MAKRVHKLPVGRPRTRKGAERYRRGTLTESRKQLVEEMVWSGLSLPEAAAKVGLAVVSARQAMRVPAVLAAFEAERKAMLHGERARNVHALSQVRDASENGMAVVAAVKAIEQIAEASGITEPAAGVKPGIVIMIAPEFANPAGGALRGPGGPIQIEARPIAGPELVPASSPHHSR